MSIPPGTYQISIEKDGYYSQQIDLALNGYNKVEKVQAYLQSTTGYGYLTVSSSPEADQIWLNDTLLKQDKSKKKTKKKSNRKTPLDFFQLAAGTYKIVLKNTKYNLAKEEQIEIKPKILVKKVFFLQ